MGDSEMDIPLIEQDARKGSAAARMLNNGVSFEDSLTEDERPVKAKAGVSGPQANIMDQISKSIAMETGSKYRNYSSKRRIEKDKTDHYRKGPAPIEESDAITKSTLKATYGTLDSDVEDLDFEEVRHQNSKNNYYNKLRLTTNEKGDNLASCRALIVYFSKLAKSKDEEELIDLNFVESLLDNGADINFPDKHGQTVLHEISRGWHPDVARFAIEHGADLNKCDSFGRTSLHLAAAVDYDDMVQFLVDNGADLGAKTFGEEQTAMHYAAKNNAASSIKVMLRLGARINDRDYKRRTPLFVAAETARTDAARFLIDRGAPAGVYDSSGTSCLSLMIEKMPQIALEAVEQFHLLDLAFRKHYYYLSYLEPDPAFMVEYIPESKKERKEQVERRKAEKRLLKDSGQRVTKKEKSYAKTPLEVIVQYDQLDIIMHPVFQRLLHVKWNLFGKRGSAKMLALNFLYTLIWTILGILIPRDHRYYTPFSDMWWRPVLEISGVSLTIYFIFMEISEVRSNEKKHNNWRQWRTRHMEKDLEYCHPRWPEEKQYLTSELLQIRGYQRTYFRDPWNIFEWISYLVVLTLVFTRVLSVASNNHTAAEVHPKVYALGLIVLWLRFMRSCRVFQTLGPFIAILGSVVVDTAKFSFLLFEFFVPYTVGFWIIFGGPENASKMTKNDWNQFNDLTFSVFSMTLMGGFDWAGLVAVDRLMAQILCGSYFALAGVVCMNLYIALLSDTFARVYAQAKATAVMQQAKTIIKLEGKLAKFYRSKYAHYFHKECSPQEVYTRDESQNIDEHENGMLERVSRQIVNRIDSMEENVIGQHKKLQLYQQSNEGVLNAPPLDIVDNGDGGNDDGFGGSGSLGGGGSSGDAGCRVLMNRFMEIQNHQYQDVKDEMDDIKSMLNDIFSIIQGGSFQPPSGSQLALGGSQQPLLGIHPPAPQPSTHLLKSASLPRGSPHPPPIMRRRGSEPPAEISSLLKNIQDLVNIDPDQENNLTSKSTGNLPVLPSPVTEHPADVPYPMRTDQNPYPPGTLPPIDANNVYPPAHIPIGQPPPAMNPYPPVSKSYPSLNKTAAYPPDTSMAAYPPGSGSNPPPSQKTSSAIYPPLTNMDRKTSSNQEISKNRARSLRQQEANPQSNRTPPPSRFGRDSSAQNTPALNRNTFNQEPNSDGSTASTLTLNTSQNNVEDNLNDYDTEIMYQNSAPNTPGRNNGRRRRRKQHKKQSSMDGGIPMNYTETM
uniref:Ion transport domain-containing protein n=1 Tax=Clytia hemisphaerica TaxID=252671 RepID=A0A7M5WS19_9CNID